MIIHEFNGSFEACRVPHEIFDAAVKVCAKKLRPVWGAVAQQSGRTKSSGSISMSTGSHENQAQDSNKHHVNGHTKDSWEGPLIQLVYINLL